MSRTVRWPSHKELDLLAYICGDVVSPAPAAEWPKSDDTTLEIVLALATPRKVWPVDLPARASLHQNKVPQTTEFEKQKEAFKSIPPRFLAPYQGQFVASHNGHIVDSDTDLSRLTHRFFEQNGKVPVYITRIGKPVRMPSPFVR